MGIRTITSDYEEFIIVGDFVNGDVREGGDNLLLRGKVGALFELEITDGSGERKVAIDSTEIDEPSSGTYSCLLACVYQISESVK